MVRPATILFGSNQLTHIYKCNLRTFNAKCLEELSVNRAETEMFSGF